MRPNRDQLWTTVRLQVDGHQPADARETKSRVAILEALERLSRPFDRYSDSTHVTGSAIVVGPRGTLLHLHKKIGKWLQPGGHLEPDETPWDAAARETEEETGLVPSHPIPPMLVHVDVHSVIGGHVHLDLQYLMAAPNLDPVPQPDESPEVRWFSWDEAIALADPGLIGGLMAARSIAAQ